jgi:hypothetical protein
VSGLSSSLGHYWRDCHFVSWKKGTSLVCTRIIMSCRNFYIYIYIVYSLSLYLL